MTLVQLGGVWIDIDGGPICPDRLRLAQIGEADGVRGRVVRLFFWLLDRLAPIR